MKKTISVLWGLTILSACGTDNNNAIANRHSPEFNSQPQANNIPPQQRKMMSQVNNYAPMPIMGNSLIPPPPPVAARQVALQVRPVQTVQINNAVSNVSTTDHRLPQANLNASGLGSADLLGPVPPPVVTKVPLSADGSAVPSPVSVARVLRTGPVQKIQSVALNMPKGSVIPPAPAKSAKPLIQIPVQVAAVPPTPTPTPTLTPPLALPPVAQNVSPAQSVDKPVPAPVPEIHNVALLPPVAQTMPQGPVFSPAPVVAKPPEPKIHEVLPLQSVAKNMPQGSVLPPAPSVPKPPEPQIYDVVPLQASTELMPQNPVAPPVPPLTVQANTQNESIAPLEKTQIVVSAAPEISNVPAPAPVKIQANIPAPAPNNIIAAVPANIPAVNNVPAPPVPQKKLEVPKLVAQASDANIPLPVPTSMEPVANPVNVPNIPQPNIPQPNIAAAQTIPNPASLENVTQPATAVVAPPVIVASQPPAIAAIAQPSIAATQTIPTPNVVDNKAADFHNSKYDQYPDLVSVPPAPPKPGPADADPRVMQMKQDLQTMQNKIQDENKTTVPVATAVTPITPTIIEKPANEAVVVPPVLVPIPATAPTPAPAVQAAEIPTPAVPQLPQTLMPKGPTLIVKSDESGNTSNEETKKPVAEEVPILPQPQPQPQPQPLPVAAAPEIQPLKPTLPAEDNQIVAVPPQLPLPPVAETSTPIIAPTPQIAETPAPPPAKAPAAEDEAKTPEAAAPGKVAGFLVPPAFVKKPVQQTIHEGASSNNAADNNFENIQPISIDHSGFLPESRYSKSDENVAN